MIPRPIKRALISVYDKTGVVDFARALHEEFGIEIISTGGTASLLIENHVPVTPVEAITGFGEMLDGRVKTLHPKIFGAILADRDNPQHMRQLADAGIEPIDMVVVNLYPFEDTVAEPNCTFEKAIEMIDVGGPSLLRAAAKNHKHVVVVGDPELYEETLGWLRETNMHSGERPDLPRREASETFVTTSMYDAGVGEWLGRRVNPEGAWPWYTAMFARDWGTLRYGENPHQPAELLQTIEEEETLDLTVADAECDGEMSFNNFADASAALDLCNELCRERGRPIGANVAPQATCAFVKHTNPCGVGVANDPIEAYRRAYLGDPQAAMGGVLAVSVPVNSAFAEAVMNSLQRWGRDSGAGAFFIEVWVAPTFDEDAVQRIRGQKNWGRRVRLLTVGDLGVESPLGEFDLRRIAGGLLMQTPDRLGLNEEKWYTVTDRPPTDQEMSDLRLAWLICKHTKSNAISLVRDGQLIGNGAGQTSRVMSCRVATWLAMENGHLGGTGAMTRRSDPERPSSRLDSRVSPVAASDAFFPFRDGPDILIDAGVTAIIQPGGSKRDAETIAACNERGVAMVLTQTRHLRH